jgi:hypothetical protein
VVDWPTQVPSPARRQQPLGSLISSSGVRGMGLPSWTTDVARSGLG